MALRYGIAGERAKGYVLKGSNISELAAPSVRSPGAALPRHQVVQAAIDAFIRDSHVEQYSTAP